MRQKKEDNAARKSPAGNRRENAPEEFSRDMDDNPFSVFFQPPPPSEYGYPRTSNPIPGKGRESE